MIFQKWYKQRTTRLNRVYEWKKVRIIDTPGIGAPGGKTDEEIAESIVPESDIICYVVTNDSIQETEFNFLHLLKKNAKPLIIVLNVMENLRDPDRLEDFLDDPDELFVLEGSDSLEGHIERIRRKAKEHYTNDYFDIFPVMLLAAQLSSEPEHQHHKNLLFKASRIQNFLDSIRLSIVENGTIRRSQTLLGCTVGDINNPYQWVKQQTQTYQQFIDKLNKNRRGIRQKIDVAQKDTHNFLQQRIEKIFQDADQAVDLFVQKYWNYSEEQLKSEWEKTLKDIRFSESVAIAYKEALEKFNKDVQQALEEIGREFQLIAKLEGFTFSFTKQDSGDERDFLRIGGGILAVAGALMAFVPPVAAIGVVIGIVGGVISFIGGFFKSKEQKRSEAVKNISKSLRSQLNNQKQTTLSKALEQLRKTCDDVTTNVVDYFEELIKALEAILDQLKSAQSKLENTANDLNRAYAKRIIDWCLNSYQPLSNEGINDVIAVVNRDFGRSITIETKAFLQLQRTQDEINRVLQEDISIQIPPSPTPVDPQNSNFQTYTSLKPQAVTNSKEKFR